MAIGAVCDLGSSSFQLLVCEYGPSGVLRPLLKRRALLNLGHDVGSKGNIPPGRVSAAVSAAKRLRRAVDAAKPDVVVALATAALRDAANGRVVVDRLEKALGVPVTVLDGPEEAQLCFAGQRASVYMSDEPTMGVDLGGGSFEIAVGNRFEVNFAATAPLGATRLRGEIAAGDPLTREDRKEVRERAREAVEATGIIASKYMRAARRTVLSGGTARALARMVVARAKPYAGRAQWCVNQVELSTSQVAETAEMLARMDLRQRLKLPGVSASRAPALPLGACILQAVAEELNVGHYVVSEWGLREGTLLEVLSDQGQLGFQMGQKR